MLDSVLWILLGINGVALILLVLLFFRAPKGSSSLGKELREELRLERTEERQSSAELRQEISQSLQMNRTELSESINKMYNMQQGSFENFNKNLSELKESNQSSLERIRTTFDQSLKSLQEGNEKKLEEMRKTVDEKLHDTLEKRLGDSFKQVSERLEAVHKGLGEMQSLATGVGDLKRIFSNVKVRGTWAEVQLGSILEQMLTPSQYEKNVAIKSESSERVEYAIRLPGPKDNPNECIWLPIDSKFPQEDYIRLQDAAEKADSEAVKQATDSLIRAVRQAAKDISEKYIYPPYSTDYAIMFLATEGLYAEVLRQPAFIEELQSKFRVVIAGPTTLSAILSSLRMGFQTVAIEQRASEIRSILGAVKTEFRNYGELIDKAKKQLATVSNTLDKTGTRTRAIERKLKSIEELPEQDATAMLALDTLYEIEEEEE
jgi:DNA recombination protein RmuC